MSGRLSAWLNNGVPHFGQKVRRIVLPLLAVLTYFSTAPVSCRPAVLKKALMVALPAARYWQSRHQQARVAIGSWSNWNLTAPQKQRPVTGLAMIASLPELPHKL